MFIFILTAILLIIACYGWACGFRLAPPQQIPAYSVHLPTTSQLPAISKLQPPNLKVLSWNISFAQGKGSEGTDYIPRTRFEMLHALDEMANIFVQHNVDVVLLQEVDFHSQRSFYINQMEYLAQKSELPQGLPCVSWDVNYLPFPSSHPFGKIKSGGAILSRYPLQALPTVFLPKPLSRSFLQRPLYLWRYLQMAQVTLPHGGGCTLFNTHLEAFDAQNRELHFQLLIQELEGQLVKNKLLLGGGDFNSITQNATPRLYPHGDNYPQSAYLEQFAQRLQLQEILKLKSDTKNLWTFPAHNVDRRLDYLFHSPLLKLESAKILPTGLSSDHLPILAEFSF